MAYTTGDAIATDYEKDNAANHVEYTTSKSDVETSSEESDDEKVSN